MTEVCELCVQIISPDEPSTCCMAPDYSAEDFESMGLAGQLADSFTCGRLSHTSCLRRLSAPRECCQPPILVHDLCFHHSPLRPGFLCLDCDRWHSPSCAAQGVIESLGGVPQGICQACARAGRVEVAVRFLTGLPIETLELVVDTLRDVNPTEKTHLVGALTALRDLRAVRIPHAYQPKISAAMATRAIQRVLAAARTLQSGLEREFYELLSTVGLDQEFLTQQPIPIEVAAREGHGRKGVVVTPDFLHRSLPYAVFLDGRSAHSTEDALIDDAEISTELAHRGFLVRRYRWRQLLPSHRAQTLDTIRRDLAHLRAEAPRKALV